MATERIDIIVSQRGAKEVRRDIEGIGTGAKTASSEVQFLKRALTVIGVGTIARETIRLSDAYTTITNRLKLATNNTAELVKVERNLFEISQRTRSEFTTNVQLYNRLAIASKELGASQQTLLTFTEAVGNALAIGGGTVESTRGALIQLSQAVGTTIVRAEEFNSILEGAPRIAQAAAAGLDKAGGSVAKLRKLIVDGKVTSKEFFDAILSQAPKLAEEFSKTNTTIAQSFVRLENAMTRFIGKSGSVSGGAQLIAKAINGLADNIETLGNILVVVAGFLGAKFLINLAKAGVALVTTEIAAFAAARTAAKLAPAMLGVGTAAGGAAVGVGLLGRAMAFLGGPIGIAFLAVTTAMAFHTDRAAEAQLRYSDALEKFGPLAEQANSKNKERAANARTEANNIINAHVAELSSLNLLIEGYAESNALLLGLREFAGKVGIGTAPSEVMAQADAARETIKQMRELLNNPLPAGTAAGGGGEDPTTASGSKKSKADILGEENLKLDEQIRLLGMSAQAREVENKVIDVQRQLREAGFTLSAQEEEQLRMKIEAYVKLNEQIQAQETLYDSIMGPQENYVRGLEAANALLDKGKISTEQYTATVRDLRIAMLDTATDAASGFERGLLKVRKEFEDTSVLAENVVTNMSANMEDALVEFAKTGKLSFRSLIDSMIEDIIRLQARRALLDIFGGGGGGGGGGMGGGILGGLVNFGTSLLSGGFNNAGQAGLPWQSFGNVNPAGGVYTGMGFATGTSFTVPGGGGVDSQQVAFKASPGERVTVDRPGQERRGGDNFTFNITTPTPDSFRQSENQIAAQVARAIAKSRRNT